MPSRIPFLRPGPGRRDVVVGVDLSPGRFKVVALAAGPAGPELVGAVDEPSAGEPGDRRFDPARIAARLRRIVAGMGARPRVAALALGPADALVRRLGVVPQPRDATLAALALQLAPALGADIAAPRVDYVPLQGPASGGRVPVLAAAGRPEAISAHRQALLEAGFEPGPVVPAAAALASAWRALGPRPAAERVLLLHVGDSAVLWMVLEEGEPVALDAPLVGVAALRDRAGTRREPGGGLADPAPEAVAEWVARIRQEVQRGLQAARREADQGDAASAGLEVWLCGGGARIPGIAAALSRSLVAPVHLFDPVQALGAEMEGVFGPALAPAIGAALQALAPDAAAPALDLRPAPATDAPEMARVPLPVLARRVARDGAFRLAAAAALAGCVAAWSADARRDAAAGRLAARESRVSADSARVATAMAQSQALASRRRLMGAAVDRLRVLERGRDLWPRVLDGVAGALPATAWVSAIAEEREDPATGAVTLRVRGYAPSDVVTSAFERRLAGSAGVVADGARTGAIRIGSVAAVEFELDAQARTDSAEVRP